MGIFTGERRRLDMKVIEVYSVFEKNASLVELSYGTIFSSHPTPFGALIYIHICNYNTNTHD